MDTESSCSVQWVKDSDAEKCMKCHAPFQFLVRRRHHCRKCGHVVCSKCSRQRQVIGEKEERVCDICHRSMSKSSPSGTPKVAAGSKNWFLADDLLDSTVGPANEDHRSRVYGTLKVTVVEARGLLAADASLMSAKSSDPYCVLRMDDYKPVRTRTVPCTLEPRWQTEVSFDLCRADSLLRVEVWDEDTLNADDPLGFVEFHLGSLRAGDEFKGWVQLQPPEGMGQIKSGAISLEFQLQEFRPWPHAYAFVDPLPSVKTPLPPFDIDELYAPGMKLQDLLWTRLGEPALAWVLDLIFWKHYRRSLCALILWNVGARCFLAHWPALSLLLLALWILSNRSEGLEWRLEQQRKAAEAAAHKLERQGSFTHRILTRMRSAPAALTGIHEDEQATPGLSHEEENHLGDAVSRLCFVLPRSIKDLCRSLQPTMRLAADSVQLLHDILTWRHPHSPAASASLVVLAAIVEALRFSTIVMIMGSGVLLACSPITTAALGLVSYASWATSRQGAPEGWRFSESYQDEWSSEDYKPAAVGPKSTVKQRFQKVGHAVSAIMRSTPKKDATSTSTTWSPSGASSSSTATSSNAMS